MGALESLGSSLTCDVSSAAVWFRWGHYWASMGTHQPCCRSLWRSRKMAKKDRLTHTHTAVAFSTALPLFFCPGELFFAIPRHFFSFFRSPLTVCHGRIAILAAATAAILKCGNTEMTARRRIACSTNPVGDYKYRNVNPDWCLWTKSQRQTG